MNKRNYQKELDQVLDQLCTDKEETAPTLLLHSCCAPCSSYVLEYLSRYFRITVLYYNPNIYPESEYHNRVQEQMRLIRELPTRYPVDFLEGDYIPADFYHCAKGMEEIIAISTCPCRRECMESLELLFNILKRTFGCNSWKASIACKRQQCRAVSVALMVMEPSSRDSRFVIFCSPLKNWAHPAETYSKKVCPSEVSSIPDLLRIKSRQPRSSSSLWIVRVTAGWLV